MQIVCPNAEKLEIDRLFFAAKEFGEKIGSKRGYDVYKLNVRIDSGSAIAKPFIVSWKDSAPYKMICKYYNNKPTEIFDKLNGTVTTINKDGDMFSRYTYNAETGELLDSFNIRKDFGNLFNSPGNKTVNNKVAQSPAIKV